MQKIVLKAAANRRRVLMVRKVKNTISQSIFRLTLDVLRRMHGMLPGYKIDKSELVISMANGSQFIYRGLDDAEKLKSIADITDIVIEEATELSLNDFTQLDIRLRPPEAVCPQIYLMFNPVSRGNWCYERWIERPPDNAAVIRTTYQDNRFLSREYKKTLEELIRVNPAYYRIYCLGEFASLDKLVFPTYEKRLIGEAEIREFPLFVGLDFGYVNDPSAIVWGRLDEKGRRIFVTGEYVRKGMLNAELCDALRQLGFAKEVVVADGAEQKSIEEIRRGGISRIRAAKKGAGSVMQDIERMLGYRLVVDERLTEVVFELEHYAWQKERGEYINRPADRYNHCMDALRYGLQAVMEKRGMRILK